MSNNELQKEIKYLGYRLDKLYVELAKKGVIDFNGASINFITLKKTQEDILEFLDVEYPKTIPSKLKRKENKSDGGYSFVGEEGHKIADLIEDTIENYYKSKGQKYTKEQKYIDITIAKKELEKMIERGIN